jgi:hypothetical protein
MIGCDAPVPHPQRMFTLSAAILMAITVAPSVILQVQTNAPAHLCGTILPGSVSKKSRWLISAGGFATGLDQ